MKKRFGKLGHSTMKMTTRFLVASLCLTCLLAGCTKQGEDNGGEAEETEKEAIVVSSAEEFFDAIEPGAVIEFKKGTYDFTPDIEELYDGDGKKFNKKHEYVKLEECYDGVQIVIKDVEGLTISGQEGKKVELQVEPRYADVLTFDGCQDISISNLTVGHTTEQGECTGDVLEFIDCEDITLDGMDLYGCGAYGITASDSAGINVTGSTIRDCSYGAILYNNCESTSFKNCTITGMQGYVVIDAYESEITYNKCTFEDNYCGNNFVSMDATNNISFKACTFGSEEAAAVNGGNLGDDVGLTFDSKCTFADFVPSTYTGGTYVSDGIIDTPEDILEAIEAGGEVNIEDGYYNLSEFVEGVDVYEWNNTHTYVTIEEVYDGKNVYVTGVEGLRISSKSGDPSKCEIVVDPRYAEIFNFSNCSDLVISGITMGHTDLGSCAGDVLEFFSCDEVWLHNMDLYGCGVYGICSNYSGTMHVYDTVIHDCEYGPASIYYMDGNMYFENCTFENSNGSFGIGASEYKVYFENCTFGDNETAGVYFSHFAEFTNCEFGDMLYYPENGFGGASDLDIDQVTITDYMNSNYSMYSFWEGMEGIGADGTSILLPSYSESGYYYAFMHISDDGTGYVEGLFDEDVVYFDWEVAADDSCLILKEVEHDGFDGFEGDAYVYFYQDENNYYPEYCMMDVDGIQIWYYMMPY